MNIRPDYETETDFRAAVAAGERPAVYSKFDTTPSNGLEIVTGPVKRDAWCVFVIVKDGRVTEVK